MSSDFSLADGSRRTAFRIYFIFSLITLAVTVAALILFQKYRALLPACFLCAAVMEISHVVYLLMRDDKNRRKSVQAVFWGLMAFLLVILGVISITAYV